MARAAPSDEQLQLRRRARRRLIGAIAAAIVIAVVLPWVLESEPRPSEEEISIQIPSPESTAPPPRAGTAKEAAQDKQAPQDKNAAQGKQTAQGGSTGADPAAAGAEAERASADDNLRAEQDKALAAPEKATSERSAPTSEARTKASDKTDAAARQFVVQIAALADADKARDIQRELSTKGLKAYTEKVKSGNGDVTRVRVGPFPTREAAEKERARLKTLGFEGNVAPR